MIQDSHAVPVTVTVPARPHHPAGHGPGGSLAFTGSPLEQLTALGLVVAAAGAALARAARRRTAPSRSSS